uniref:KAT8 regulatory NSL complex subunit 1-like protein n=1 Tax=Euleptes europaea TaxID=460621 RepID=UPI00253FD041|nr:KAT8 regulatory NSL complex subunit 1-like protein [Euleptes europaea]
MTPALREKVMKGHGICLPPSLSSKAMESSETLGMGNAKTVKEKIKEDSVTQITYSVLGFPTPQSNLQSDLFSLKYFGSQSSKHYPLLTNPNSSFSIYNKHCMQKNLEEQNCFKARNPLFNSTNTHFNQIINSESREQVQGGNLLSVTTQNSSETGKPSEPRITESGHVEERQLPNCKWHWKNGFFSKSLFANTEMKEGNVFHQVHHEALETTMDCSPSSKEQELNFRLLQCVNKQQALLSRAKRTQKHLQILLAKHVVKHCDQQIKYFVKHQLQRMNALHNPSRMSGGSYHRCAEIRTGSNNLEARVNKHLQRDFTVAPGEIQVFTRSATGILSHVEKSLDSDATCSSSSEEDDEQISRRAVALKYRSDWQWLVDRAKIGCCWTWLQAQISEIEYKIQQLTNLHRQIRATKGMVVLEELSTPKDILKKQTQWADGEALLRTTGNSQAHLERRDAWPENDFEISPSSPTLLLRNIEKQSAQLSEIISSLMAPFSLSPTASPLSSKSCKQKDTVNGISVRGPETREEISSSSSWLVDQQHLKRRRKDKTRLKASSVLAGSTSARTRPVQSFQRRKLYKMKTAFDLNQQAMTLRDALLHPNIEKVAPASTWDSYEHCSRQLMLELDSSFHPILSFPSDIPLHVHLKSLLQKSDIRGDPFETSALGLEFEMSPSNGCHQDEATSRQWSCGHPSGSNHQPLSEIPAQLPEGRKKRHLSETTIVAGAGNSRFEAFSFLQEEQESHDHFTGAADGNVSRASDSSSSQPNLRRRLRCESSYDIDNIVIPMSLVAPSKLEKLQYKEILTPSWRTVSLVPLGSLHEDQEKAEDLSDEAYSSRHAKYEEKERARWSLWEQCQWPKRNRTFSRNLEGYETALKHDNSDLAYHFGENTADTSESDSSLCSSVLQSLERNQEPVLWERRTFPLQGKGAEALIRQEQLPVQRESSAPAPRGESDCASPAAFCLPNHHELHKKRSAGELADGDHIALVTGSTREQRRGKGEDGRKRGLLAMLPDHRYLLHSLAIGRSGALSCATLTKSEAGQKKGVGRNRDVNWPFNRRQIAVHITKSAFGSDGILPSRKNKLSVLQQSFFAVEE